eukprot:6596819-Pyramimonas_sp.AAC.1
MRRPRAFHVGLWVATLCGVVLQGRAQTSGFAWRNDATQFGSNSEVVYNDVSTVEGSTRGWLVGSGDTILRTENLGLEWTPLSSGLGSGYDWHAVDFSDVNTGWVVGTWVKVARTTDGGNTWAEQDLGLGFGTILTLRAVEAVNATVAWAAGDAGTLVTTTDGGTNWRL